MSPKVSDDTAAGEAVCNPSRSPASAYRSARGVAREGPWPLADLQRQFAYDRLLHRLYPARHTIDLDIYRTPTRTEAQRDLRAAAAIDASDWFEFELGPGHALPREQPEPASQLPPASAIPRASFRVDLVGETVEEVESRYQSAYTVAAASAGSRRRRPVTFRHRNEVEA